MLGPYIKSRVTRAIEMSSNAALITMETNVQQGEQFENQFFIYEPKCKKKIYILGYLGGLEGVFNDQTGHILLSSYPLTHIYVQGNNLIRNF